MREIVLDTETTGLDPESGDRIVEIGAVELWNHVATGETYHVYINPERSIPEDAFGIHGIGPDLLESPRPPEKGEVTLKDKPVFAKVGRGFREFVGDSKLIIHNAPFDMKFLNAELGWMDASPIPMKQVIDTLEISRKRFPGSPGSLDALCRRFGIDNSNRLLHGALLDSEILAEVYLELIGGRQPDFGLSGTASAASGGTEDWRPTARPTALPSRITGDERAAHQVFVEKLGENALWTRD